MLGITLGEVIRNDPTCGESIFGTVEKMRHLSREWRWKEEEGKIGAAAAKFDELCNMASEMNPDEMRNVARAFTHFLALSNAAESHHRIRRVRAREQLCESAESK